jgi:hypothetical protein
MSFNDLYGDEEEHPAAYNDTPTPINYADPDWTRNAAYHLRRVAHWEARYNEIMAAFDREIERLHTRQAEATEPIANKIEWHRRPLVQLHQQILASDPTRKTLTLPGGTIKSRTPSKPTVTVTDHDQFEMWAHTNAPHLLHVAFSPDRTALAAAIAAGELVAVADVATGPVPLVNPSTGETIPGVQLSVGSPTFKVVPDEDIELA